MERTPRRQPETYLQRTEPSSPDREEVSFSNKRLIIDVGKTGTRVISRHAGQTTINRYDSTWVGGTYGDFVGFLSGVITQSDSAPGTSEYIQIAVPFPFDVTTQRITTIKPTRPDFTPDRDMQTDLHDNLPPDLYGDTKIRFINDAHAKTYSLAQRLSDESFMVLHQGTGINASVYDRGAVSNVEIADVPEGERRFSPLRGNEITKSLSRLAGVKLEDVDSNYSLLVEQASENQEFATYKSDLHDRWLDYVAELTAHGNGIRTLVIPERLMTGDLFPLEAVSNLGLEVRIIPKSEQELIGLDDLELDDPQVSSRIAETQTRLQLRELARQDSQWHIEDINQIVDDEEMTDVRASVRSFFSSKPEFDIRDTEQSLLLYKKARELQRIQREGETTLAYPLPQAVRLDSAHSPYHKFIVEFAHSLDVVEALPPNTKIGISIPLYDESTRVSPKGEDNPLGEDLIRNKLFQLEQLFARSNASYEVVFVDDGSHDNTYSLVQDIITEIGPNLKKGNVKGVRLSDALAAEEPLKIAGHLHSETESIKGGASLAGAELLTRSGAQFIVLSDADLEIHVGSLGVLLEPMVKEEHVAMTIAHRQKFLTDAGKGLAHILSIFKDKGRFNDKFRYLIPRFAVCQTYFPHIADFPDYQTGFKGIRASTLPELFETATNFSDSYDFDLVEYAQQHGDIKNVPVTPVFVSKEASKFPYESKIKKFGYYDELARERNSPAGYYGKRLLYPVNYIRAVVKDLLVPGIILPHEFDTHRNYFTDLDI